MEDSADDGLQESWEGRGVCACVWLSERASPSKKVMDRRRPEVRVEAYVHLLISSNDTHDREGESVSGVLEGHFRLESVRYTSKI